MKPNFHGSHGTRAEHREQEAAAEAAYRRANGLAAGARFPAELIPHAAARRLLESLGVSIVAGDADLIARVREQVNRAGASRRVPSGRPRPR